jgi:hypothetical protein
MQSGVSIVNSTCFLVVDEGISMLQDQQVQKLCSGNPTNDIPTPNSREITNELHHEMHADHSTSLQVRLNVTHITGAENGGSFYRDNVTLLPPMLQSLSLVKTCMKVLGGWLRSICFRSHSTASKRLLRPMHLPPATECV